MKRTIDIPDDWTTEQALAACEMLYELTSAIWDTYDEPLTQLCRREAIRDAARELEPTHDPNLYADGADEIPF